MTQPLIFDLIGKDNASVAFARVSSAADRLARNADQARRALDRLGTKATRVDITTNADTAIAKIKAVQSAADKANKANKPTLGLGTAIAALGPAAIPVAAVAGGALAGLAPVAATAVLAVKGLENEFKSGALAGTAFGRDIATAQTEVSRLEQIAASGVLGGLDKGLQAIKPQIPLVNKDVAAMSAQLGDIAGHVGPGFVSLFVRAQPLMQTFGTAVDKGAASFQHWAQSSTSVSRFIAYAQQELPVVESTLTNLATTAGHTIQALEPFGSTTLQGINLLSKGINAVPVPVLQAIAPALSGAFVGGKIGSAIAAGGQKLSDWSQKAQDAGGMAESLSGVAGKMGKVLGHAGVIGAAAGTALGLMSSVMGMLDHSAQQAAVRVNDLTQAMQNGTITAQAWKNAQATGADAATKLGVSQQTLLQGITGTEAQYRAAQSAVQRYGAAAVASSNVNYRFGASTQQVSDYQNQLNVALDKAKSGLAESRKEYEAAKQKLADWATQQGDAGLAAQIASGSYATQAKVLGVTAGAYLSAKLAADNSTKQTQAQTLAFQLENDAASLVNQALNTMAGQNLGNAQAQTAMDQALLSMTSALKTNHGVLSQHTTAGLADRQAIEGAVSALRAKASAEASATGSTEKATAQYGVNAKALLATIGRLDGTKSAAYKYAQQLLKIPSVVKTAADLQTDAAKRKLADLNTYIKTHTPHVYIETSVSGAKGEYIPGVGYVQLGKGSASGTNGRGLPLGVSAVGERGPELAVNSGRHVEILSNQQSKAFLAATGMKAPGFAGGTVGGTVAAMRGLVPPTGMRAPGFAGGTVNAPRIISRPTTNPRIASTPRGTGLGELIAELRATTDRQDAMTDALVDVAVNLARVAQRPIDLDGRPFRDQTDRQLEAAIKKLTTVKKHGRK